MSWRADLREAEQPAMFNQQQQQKPNLFGTPSAAASPFSFGTPAAPVSVGPAFGKPAAPVPQFGGFGGATTSTTGFGLQQPPTNPFGGFGQQTPTFTSPPASTSFGSFGQQQPQPSSFFSGTPTAASTTAGFGSSFGLQPSTSSTSSTSSPFSGFGATKPNPASTFTQPSGSFGTSNQTKFGSFGATSSFGAPTSAASTAVPATSNSFSFGASNAGSSLSSSMSSLGNSVFPVTAVSEKDKGPNVVMSITGNSDLQSFSLEEVRLRTMLSKRSTPSVNAAANVVPATSPPFNVSTIQQPQSNSFGQFSSSSAPQQAKPNFFSPSGLICLEIRLRLHQE